MINKPKIYFRADGNAKIGLGHVIRSLALAEMLADDFDCHFIIRKPLAALRSQILSVCQSIIELDETEDDIEEANALADNYLTGEEIVVLDGYRFITEYQNAIKNKAHKLVCIDDIHSCHFTADVVINHAGGIKKTDYSAEKYTQFYLGLPYLLLRKPFREAAKNSVDLNDEEAVFICLGGADPNNDTIGVLQKCVDAQPDSTYYIVTGSAYLYKTELDYFIKNISSKVILLNNLTAKEMAFYMGKCKKAITPPSTISYEYLSVGGTLYLKIIADNQMGIYDYLIQNKLARDFNAQSFLSEKHEAAHNIVLDGKQQKRFVGVFYDLVMGFQEADLSDLMLYFNWANEEETRKQSFNSDPISLDSHTAWFKAKVNSKDTILFIAKVAGVPIGQIRFDVKENNAYIAYSIDAKFRGKGLGKLILEKGIQEFKNKHNAELQIIGFVKFQNVPSCKIFRSLGFQEEIAETYDDSYKYILA